MNLHTCNSQLNTACHTTGSEAELGGFADGVKQSAKPEASGDCHSHSCQQSVWSASVRKPGLAQNCGLVPCGGSGGFTFLVPRVAGPDPSSCFSVSCDSSEDQSPFRTMASCAPSSVALLPPKLLRVGLLSPVDPRRLSDSAHCSQEPALPGLSECFALHPSPSPSIPLLLALLFCPVDSAGTPPCLSVPLAWPWAFMNNTQVLR